jgi:serine-type D-Ala-D-Ala carboxypeptidase (penicillin-binding protein 5/6)
LSVFRSLFVGFALVLASQAGLAASATPPPPPADSLAEYVILIDAKTGQTLYEKNADTAFPPASMSKLMTMLMVFEALKSGQLTLEDPITISVDAWKRGGASSGGSTMYADVNSQIRLVDVMHGVMIQSANDGSIALAEHLGGSEELFSQNMTKRARELGLKTATFRNATGLPAPDHKMTARELALLAEYIIRAFPAYYAYYSEPAFTWNKITQANRNPLLKDYPGADGVKTGYTQESGYGLVGSATREGRRLILVVAGLKTIADRKAEARRLLDWGFSQFQTVEAFKSGEKVGRARVWSGTASHVTLVTQGSLRVLLSPQEQKAASAELVYTGPLYAPVAAGAAVGELRVKVHGAVIAQRPVFAAEAVDEAPEMWRKALDRLLILMFGS